MSISHFNDRTREPSTTEVREVMGTALSLWDELVAVIRREYSPHEEFKFMYGKNYGWGWRFRNEGKLLTVLYPSPGGFTVQIILSPESIEAVLSADYGDNIHQAVNEANPYPEGRWLFIPVRNREDLKDIHRLLVIKMARK